MRKTFSTLILIFTAVIVNAQQVRPANSEKIYHEIEQLRNLVNVLYVAAHPDDENTRLLAWLVNDRNIRTAYLSLTRGDGGQNILGSEQGEALGLIRTHELMEARKLDGAEQFFSRAIDFGYSKNFDETFKHWNKDTLTNDAVWVMRKFRPDVVICRFPPDSKAGHGQHAASAIIAAEAFKVVGDKTKYPEQLKYYPQWQPKRLLFNAYRFGSFSTTSEDMFKLKVGQYEPLLGEGTGELAGQSRSVHKSQGAGTPGVPGMQTEYFKLVDGEPFTNSVFDGIDMTWGRVNRPDIEEDLRLVAAQFDFRHPDASLPALLAVRKKIMAISDEYWRAEKLDEIDRVILDCTGFMAELFAKQPQAVAGDRLPFTLHVIARAKIPVLLKSINWNAEDTTVDVNINADTLLTFEHKITIPANTPVTQPYWLSAPHSGGLFTIPDASQLGLPETPNELNASLELNIDGQQFKVKVPLSYKKLDPVKGDVVEQLRIMPYTSVSFVSNLLVAEADGSLYADVRIHGYHEIQNATLEVTGVNVSVVKITGLNITPSTDTVIPIKISTAIAKNLGKGDYYLTAFLVTGGFMSRYELSEHVIQYNHIPTLQYFTMPYSKVLRKDWKCTAKRIGYIEGAGDYIPTFLRQAGLEVDVLKESDFINAAKLKKYDAIITGIRAVNVEKRMAAWLPVLFQYAQNGGTLIMQYNTQQDLATTKLGPYPFSLSNDRVTEEDAKVDFVDPKSRLLNYPNKITDDDFKDWVQERGLYFAAKWDDKYKPLFSMHDAGEQPLTGSTLYAQVGKGNYIYTSLSFSRQLPAGNKGAIRLLMNMLSVGH
ncbi:MAG: PIG-L family deacetylase [Chitinophagales bacterium]